LPPSSGDRRTLRLLLEHRAHVNARDGRGHTALRHAARALQPRAVHELLRSGAEATFFGVALRTALRKLGALARAQDDAARHGASDAVAEILARAAQWARLLSCLARGGAPVRLKQTLVGQQSGADLQ
jgi:hypothetical protein